MQTEVIVRAGREGDAQPLNALAIQVFLHTYATQGISAAISGAHENLALVADDGPSAD